MTNKDGASKQDLPNAGVQAELLSIARMIEDLKQPCGDDPESPRAIQNGRYMTVAYAVRALAAISATPAAPEPANHLGNLLAVIHGDGGHYQDEHGTEKAVEDAIVKWHAASQPAEAVAPAHPRHEAAQGGAESAPKLPHDVKVGHNTFRRGVALSTFIEAARRWHRAAYPAGYTLTDEEKAENLRKLQAAAVEPAQAAPVAVVPGFGISDEKLQQLRDGGLKPEEIGGAPDVQHKRVRELLHWFARFTQGHANPKWATRHACELAYYIATEGCNRGLDLHAIEQSAFLEGVNISPSERDMLRRLAAKPTGKEQSS